MVGWLELEKIWKETVVFYLRYYSDIYLKGLRKCTKYLNENNRCSSGVHHETNTQLYRYTSLPSALKVVAGYLYLMSKLTVHAIRHQFFLFPLDSR
jgi:hypothetical protein